MSKQVFGEHCYDLIAMPGYYSKSFKLVDKKLVYKGIYGHFMDDHGRIIVLTITYNQGYPINPPKVNSSPPIRDVCWDSKGNLHFAMDRSHFVWLKYKDYSNPLVYLVDEITEKYKTI